MTRKCNVSNMKTIKHESFKQLSKVGLWHLEHEQNPMELEHEMPMFWDCSRSSLSYKTADITIQNCSRTDWRELHQFLFLSASLLSRSPISAFLSLVSLSDSSLIVFFPYRLFLLPCQSFLFQVLFPFCRIAITASTVTPLFFCCW